MVMVKALTPKKFPSNSAATFLCQTLMLSAQTRACSLPVARSNVLVLGFCDCHRPLTGVQQDIIHETVWCVLEILAQVLTGGKCPARNARLANDCSSSMLLIAM